MYVGTVLRFISRAVCVCVSGIFSQYCLGINWFISWLPKVINSKLDTGRREKNKRIFFNSPFSPAISGHVEISDVDRDGKNLHQGQAIGNDLLTDTEEECISLLIFFDFHNHFIIIANLRKVLQYRRVFIQKLQYNYCI